MPSSLAPIIAFYLVVDEVENVITDVDFSTVTVGETTTTAGPYTIRIKNESNATDALSPIIYLGGADAEEISLGEWCKIKVTSDNSVPVTTDEFETVTDNVTTTKELSVDIEAGSYIDISLQMELPPNTLAGQYDWKLALKYEYTS